MLVPPPAFHQLQSTTAPSAAPPLPTAAGSAPAVPTPLLRAESHRCPNCQRLELTSGLSSSDCSAHGATTAVAFLSAPPPNNIPQNAAIFLRNNPTFASRVAGGIRRSKSVAGVAPPGEDIDGMLEGDFCSAECYWSYVIHEERRRKAPKVPEPCRKRVRFNARRRMMMRDALSGLKDARVGGANEVGMARREGESFGTSNALFETFEFDM